MKCEADRVGFPGTRFLLAVGSALIIGSSWAAEGPLHDLLGPIDCVAIAGNGGLTVGINEFGRISSCRWPSPGYNDQISYLTHAANLPLKGVEPRDGLMWGVYWEGETRWLAGPPWEPGEVSWADAGVVEIAASLQGSPVTARQILFVVPERDVLVARLVVNGADTTSEVYWYGNFTPCTRLIPELPFSDWALDSLNDFACFLADDDQTVVHFRPEQPRSTDWDKAKQLARRPSTETDWTDFRDGVWIAYTCLEGVRAVQCGVEGESACAFSQATASQLQGDRSAVGQCNSAIAVLPTSENGAGVATVLTAFASESQEALEKIASAKKAGYDDLLAETKQYWADWLEPVALAQDPEIAAAQRRCLVSIAQAMDRRTGAIARAPITQPPLALDWPRHGAWATLALDKAGKRDLAEAHLAFYLSAIRQEPVRGKPEGSLPATLYANGQEGLPHLLLDVEAAAWVLWALWNHSTLLPEPDAATYLESVWASVDRAGSFLESWADDQSGRPLHAFDPDRLRDSRTIRLLLRTRMGLQSALEIARKTSQSRPQWEERMASLDALVEYYCLNEAGKWKADPLDALVTAATSPLTGTAWDETVSEWLDAVDSAGETDKLLGLCSIGLAFEGNPEKLAQIRPHLRQIAQDLAQTPLFDSLHAALLYLALQSAF